MKPRTSARVTLASLTALVALVALASTATPAQAQGLGSLTGDAQETPEYKARKEKLMFGAGTFDVMLGVGGFFYPHIEPGIDIGIIPLPANINLSLGANLDLGYCVGCLLSQALLNFVSQDSAEWTIRSWYIAPQLRGLAHLGIISDIIKMPELDVYMGFGAGPAMYYTGIKAESKTSGATASAEGFQWAVFGGPLAGARYMLGSSFFVALEARYFVSWGVETTRVNLDGQSLNAGTDAIINDRYGTDYNLAIGFRL